MTFAMVPPLASTPLAPAGKPITSASHLITCSSTHFADWSMPTAFTFMPAASMSAIMPSGVPLDFIQPQKRGWRLPAV